MEVNNVNLLLPDQAGNAADHTQVERPAVVEAARADPSPFQVLHERVLPREQERGLVLKAIAIQVGGGEGEQPFRSADPQAFDQPQDPCRREPPRRCNIHEPTAGGAQLAPRFFSIRPAIAPTVPKFSGNSSSSETATPNCCSTNDTSMKRPSESTTWFSMSG